MSVLLAFVGITGVMTFSVRQQTREIGVRIALGARPARIIGLVLGVSLTMLGLVAGTPVALASSRLLENQLYGVSPHDLLTLVSVAGGLGLVAAGACYGPARGAARVDPIHALRGE